MRFHEKSSFSYNTRRNQCLRSGKRTGKTKAFGVGGGGKKGNLEVHSKVGEKGGLSPDPRGIGEKGGSLLYLGKGGRIIAVSKIWGEEIIRLRAKGKWV